MSDITPTIVRERVEAIREAAEDDEFAHGLEDSLYEDILRAIADGRCLDPVACATEALKTRDINFARWCA
jgi:hypothetical protein